MIYIPFHNSLVFGRCFNTSKTFPQMRAFDQSSECLFVSVEVEVVHLFWNSCHEQVWMELNGYEWADCCISKRRLQLHQHYKLNAYVSGALVTQSDLQLSRSWCSHREDVFSCIYQKSCMFESQLPSQVCTFDSHLRLASLDFRTARFARPAFASSCTQVLRIRSRLILHLPENC